MAQTKIQLNEILQKQIIVEEAAASDLEMFEDEVEETAVKLLLMEMRLDSLKHKQFLEGILHMMSHTPCDRWTAKVQRYIDRVKAIRKLEGFISQEQEMIDLLNQALEEMKDPLGRLLLMHLREDEIKHHEDLKEMARIINLQPLQRVKGTTGTDIVCDEPPE